MKITQILTFLIFVNGYSLVAQSKWNFEPKGFAFYGDILSFSNVMNYTKSDPRTGNFSFGMEYYFQLYSGRFYLTPGINLTYLGINGIPEEGSNYLKPIATLPIESEVLLPIIYPFAIDWKIGPLLSFYAKAGISAGGKYNITTEKLGSVLDGNDINLFAINAGFKIKFITNLDGYISAKYYFGNNSHPPDNFNMYNVDVSKVEIYNVGVGLSYNLFNESVYTKRLEQTNNKIDSLAQIIVQKNLALKEMKSSLDSSRNELKKYREIPPGNESIEGRSNYVNINIDSLNTEYNAKFYEDLPINDFLTGNNQGLSDEGKALLEGYYDVANKIEIDQRKGIFLKLFVPEIYKQIFQNYIDEMNWNNILSLHNINVSKYVRFEINLEKIKEIYSIDLEIKY